jgi:hypothetical protein
MSRQLQEMTHYVVILSGFELHLRVIIDVVSSTDF